MDSAEPTILRTLLAAPDAFVTGNELAGKLGISRVAVWAHMKKLKREGFDFEAVRNRGYRITRRPKTLSVPYLLHLLPELARTNRLHFYRETESTNLDAGRLLAAGTPAPFVVLAASQTAGRGRLGRTWHSPDEGNLYASFAFRPELSPERMQLFTLWMGVSLCNSLEADGTDRLSLKWPNDLRHGPKKLGGILTEAKVDSDRIQEIVVGIGLNVNSRPSRWPDPLRREAVSLREIRKNPLDLNALSAAVVSRLLDAYNTFIAGEFRERFDTLWKRYDALAGRQVEASCGRERITGRAEGIDASGRLLVRDAGGNLVPLHAGDVTLKKDDRTGAVSAAGGRGKA